MATETRTQEILELEQAFWECMKAKDGKAASSMTDDHCIVVGAQGTSTITSQQMERMTQEGGWELKHFTLDKGKTQVRFLTDDIVVVAYQVNEEVAVEGETLKFAANDASVWVRRDGKWLCTLHTESLAGDPFGRDRQKVSQ